MSAQRDAVDASELDAPLPFIYSLGRDRYDNKPERREAATLRAFALDVLGRRAESKQTAGYLASEFGGNGNRSRANAQARRFLALDIDHIDPLVAPELRLFLARFRGFGWPTASSTPEAPRWRVILELSDPVDRDQGIAIGALLIQDIEDNFGTAVCVDPCTCRAEQPCFLALRGAQPFYFLGDAMDVPVWLAHVQPPPPPPPPISEENASMADARMRYVVAQLGQAGMLIKPLPNARGYAIRCPWEAKHSTPDAPGTAATALLFPADANGWNGAFRCLHSHCSERRLRHLLEVLRAARERVAA